MRRWSWRRQNEIRTHKEKAVLLGCLAGVLAVSLGGCGVQPAAAAPALKEAHPPSNDKYPGGVGAQQVLQPTRSLHPALPEAASRVLPEYVARGLSEDLPDLGISPHQSPEAEQKAARQLFGMHRTLPWYYQGTTTRNNPFLLMADAVHNLAYPRRFGKIGRDVLDGSGTTFETSNPTTVNEQLHGNMAEEDPGFQTLYIPTLFTETMGIKPFQQTDPHRLSVVSAGTRYTAPVYSVNKGGPVMYTVFHAYTPGQAAAPKVTLPSGYTLQQGPGTILVGQPVSQIVFLDGGKWGVGEIQWTIIESYTNHGWYVVTLELNPVPEHMGKTPSPSSHDVSARLLP